MRLKLTATATFGLEAVVKREIQDLGYEIEKVEDGKITFFGDERAIVRSNLWLRCADRVLLNMGDFDACEFEELFQNVKGMEWEYLIPPDGRFTVTGSSVKSVLHSVPACQSIVKKAIVSRLSEMYGIEHFEETGAEYTVKVSLIKDHATITVDTSGTGLHKRGYRQLAVPAPLKETLAAALIKLSFWNKDRILVEPCCGSGTIPIEAAMAGHNIAPGLGRKFASEEWEFIDAGLWKEERRKAYEAITDEPLRIYASDVDPRSMKAAIENAANAGVEEDIYFKQINITDIKRADYGRRGDSNGIIIVNPPYGKRIGEEKAIATIYESLRRFHEDNPDWSLFMITADKTVEKKIWDRPADRRRKLYNGNVETCYYQFHGERI
jgi:putative N6-adenine-specific DNA methylase